jgi:hypothetical protein
VGQTTVTDTQTRGCEVELPECLPTPTPSPIPVLCGEGEDKVPCPTPTLTVTPVPPSNQGGPGDGRSDGKSSDPGATQAPGNPTCTVPYSFPWGLTFKRVSPTEVDVAWVPSSDGADKQSIWFGLSNGDKRWSAVDLSGDAKSFQLKNLPANVSIWYQVQDQKGGCVSVSNWIDP